MNWGQARKLLGLAHRRRLSAVSPNFEAEPRSNGVQHFDARAAEPRRARSVCVASGKGGTGKSTVCASLARLWAERERTLVVDADLGVGNAHILQGVSPGSSFVDVVEGRRSVEEIVENCGAAIDLVSGGSGVSRMAGLSSYEMHLIASGLETLETDYERVVVDSAAGVSEQTIAFARASDRTLLVTTPDLTAMTDAYAFLKVLLGVDPAARVDLVVNRVEDEEEGRRTAERILSVAERFLGRAPRWIGSLPDDPAVRRAGNRRSAVIESEPDSRAGRALIELFETLERDERDEADAADVKRAGEPREEGLGRRLVADCGFSRRFASRANG